MLLCSKELQCISALEVGTEERVYNTTRLQLMLHHNLNVQLKNTTSTLFYDERGKYFRYDL